MIHYVDPYFWLIKSSTILAPAPLGGLVLPAGGSSDAFEARCARPGPGGCQEGPAEPAAGGRPGASWGLEVALKTSQAS